MKTKVSTPHLAKQIDHDREKLEAIIQQSVDGIMVTDTLGLVQIWNPAIERLTGIQARNVVNHSVRAIHTFIPSLEKAKKEKHTELAIQHQRSGKTVWLGVTYTPIRNLNRRITGELIIVRDISRQKQLEIAKSEFVATASHELRSPLTAIVGYLSMLSHGDAGELNNQKQVFFLEKAYHNAKRMVTLVEDILATTRVEAGQVRYQIETLDLTEIADDVVSDYRFKIEERGVNVSVSSRHHQPVMADYDAVYQVMTNLLNNALKYTPDNGRIKVSFEKTRRSGRPLLITAITDNGVGIDSTLQEKIFDKFTRADNTITKTGGSGLGLYITKSIIEDLGGNIWLLSEPGRGTTFYFTLPIAKGSSKKKGYP